MNEFEVRGTYDIGYIRRQITENMKKNGFSDMDTAEISIVVNELCCNLVRHAAVGGKIQYSQIIEQGKSGIEIKAIDKGPGIENTEEMLKDGVSSKGTMGGGLGAIRRLSDYFDIYSNTNKLENNQTEPGTTVTVRKWKKKPEDTHRTSCSDIRVSVLSRPYQSDSVSGDSYYVRSNYNKDIIAVIDGLGHGSEAFEAAQRAVKTIDENTHLSVDEILRVMNLSLKCTRGAVVVLIIINKFDKEFEMLSIGNINSRLISANKTEILRTSSGFVGGYNGSFKSQKYAYKRGDILTLCTDGVSSNWDAEEYIMGGTDNPTVLCNSIFYDHAKENDDATMLVAVL